MIKYGINSESEYYQIVYSILKSLTEFYTVCYRTFKAVHKQKLCQADNNVCCQCDNQRCERLND